MVFGRLGRRLSGAGKRGRKGEGAGAGANGALREQSPRGGRQDGCAGTSQVSGPAGSGGISQAQAGASGTMGVLGPGSANAGIASSVSSASGAGSTTAADSFLPVLLGAGETAYGMARSYYEAYRVPSVAIAQQVQPICQDSGIVQAQAIDTFDTGPVFRDALVDFASQPAMAGRRLLLVPTENRYARLLSEHADELGKRYIFNIASASLVGRLALKSGFYELCHEHGLAYPAYTAVPIGGQGAAGTGRGASADPVLPGDFPLAFKPDDPEVLFTCEFRGNKNAYELRNRAELKYAQSMIAAAGFAGDFIVQRQVPGADDSLHTLTCYSDRAGRVRLVAQADVVLEQVAPWSIGHFGAVVAGADDALALQVADFLQAIGYRGFCNIDVKVDAQTGTPQFLDFNVAPCDTSYLATAAGQNLARFLVQDVLDNNQGCLESEQGSGQPNSAFSAKAPGNQSKNTAVNSENVSKYATLEPDAAMLSKVPDSTLRQYARNLSVWGRTQQLMQAGRCADLFLPPYDQSIKRKRAYRTDQHFHRREFADCLGHNHVND